jgi:hypothetical protein
VRKAREANCKEGSSRKEAIPDRSVTAVHVLGWRCPNCQTIRLSEKSGEHVGHCWQCNTLFTVLEPRKRYNSTQ